MKGRHYVMSVSIGRAIEECIKAVAKGKQPRIYFSLVVSEDALVEDYMKGDKVVNLDLDRMEWQ